MPGTHRGNKINQWGLRGHEQNGKPGEKMMFKSVELKMGNLSKKAKQPSGTKSI